MLDYSKYFCFIKSLTKEKKIMTEIKLLDLNNSQELVEELSLPESKLILGGQVTGGDRPCFTDDEETGETVQCTPEQQKEFDEDIEPYKEEFEEELDKYEKDRRGR